MKSTRSVAYETNSTVQYNRCKQEVYSTLRRFIVVINNFVCIRYRYFSEIPRSTSVCDCESYWGFVCRKYVQRQLKLTAFQCCCFVTKIL